jgi:hypothetical protein
VVKVAILRSGGVAGFVTRTELESASLPEALRPEFETRLQRALDANPPSHVASAEVDEPRYEISVDNGDEPITLRFTDRDVPGPVRELIDWTDGRSERHTSIEGQQTDSTR